MKTETGQGSRPVKHLVFQLGAGVYALPADQVKEIVADQPCFPLPFTPDWVRGVLNRHGVPFTILDLGILLGQPATESKTHILLNLADDQIALVITEVIEIVKTSDRIRTIATDPVYQGILGLDSGDVLILSLPEILKKLADDVQAR